MLELLQSRRLCVTLTARGSNPLIGYYAATKVAQEALATGQTVPEVVLAQGHMTADELQRALKPEHLANLAVEAEI